MKQTEGPSPRDVLNALFSRIYILELVVILLPLGTLVATYLVTPIFESKAKVLVTAKQESTGLLMAKREAVSTSFLSLNVEEMDLNNEMELLESPELWVSTVKKLGVGYFKDENAGPLSRWFSGLSKLFGPTEVRSGQESPEDRKVKQIATALMKHCKITPVPKSHVLNIQFRYDDPVKARKILETHLNLYIPYHSQVYATPGAHKFFEGQGAQFKEAFESSKDRLAAFKKRWNIAFPEKQKEELIKQIKNVQENLIDIRSDKTQYKEMLAALKEDKIPTGQLAQTLGGFKENTVINVIAAQLLRAQQQRLEARVKFSEDSRDYQVANELVHSLIARFKEALNAQLDNFKAKEASLVASLKMEQARLRLLEEKAEEAEKLALVAQIAKQRYLKYSAKEDETRLDSLIRGKQLVNVRIMSKPSFPTAPVFPRRWLFVIGAFLLAIPLGLGLIFLANFFDHTYSNPDQLEADTGFPVLASLKRIPSS